MPPPAISRIKPKSTAIPQQKMPAIAIPFFASCVVTNARMLMISPTKEYDHPGDEKGKPDFAATHKRIFLGEQSCPLLS
jgi:hypothetical protein